jgi:hypothetical protein
MRPNVASDSLGQFLADLRTPERTAFGAQTKRITPCAIKAKKEENGPTGKIGQKKTPKTIHAIVTV